MLMEVWESVPPVDCIEMSRLVWHVTDPDFSLSVFGCYSDPVRFFPLDAYRIAPVGLYAALLG
jgi:hypothetical protein